jgi:hypothetical protein
LKFQPGQSGNPNGRPKGTGHRQQLFNTLVEPYVIALFDIAIKLALGGNENMLRLFLERLLPARPSDDAVAIDLDMQDLTKTESLVHIGKTILQGVAHSEITPEQAKVLMVTVDAQSRQIVTHELAQRVEAIEKALKRRR